MKKVVLVIDSTADISADLIKQYNIKVVPMTMIWDGKEYEDGKDITAEEFYPRLENSETLPTTSQPTPNTFKQIYESIIEAGDSVLGIFISSHMSGTIESARQAKAMLPEYQDRIEIVDSRYSTMGMGFIVLEAAKAAAQGASLQVCKEAAEEAYKHVNLYFLVDTLEFLHRGGRMSSASALLGTMLSFKPVLYVPNGAIELYRKIRTTKKAREFLLESGHEYAKEHKSLRVAIMHGGIPEVAEEFAEKVKVLFGNVTDMTVIPLSPVVGVHTGPGTLVLAMYAED
ncbi:MAG: DegV family protein [Anaerolineales bacterium]|nr:DegV family protein [Anaerolineales bacterium]